MYAAMSSAWNLVGGFAGYPSLGHAAFFGIGAYATGTVVPAPRDHLGLRAVPAAAGRSASSAALLGLPVACIAMRTRADVFAIVTITLLFVAQTLAFNLRALTGGAQGLSIAVPPFSAAPRSSGPSTTCWSCCSRWRWASRFGVDAQQVRPVPGSRCAPTRTRPAGIGVRVIGVKLLAFAVSVGLTAMVGGVWAYYEGFIYPQFAVDPLVTIAHRADDLPRRPGDAVGPGARRVHPRVRLSSTLAYHLGGSQFYLIAYAAVFLVDHAAAAARHRADHRTIGCERRRRAGRVEPPGTDGADHAPIVTNERLVAVPREVRG